MGLSLVKRIARNDVDMNSLVKRIAWGNKLTCEENSQECDVDMVMNSLVKRIARNAM